MPISSKANRPNPLPSYIPGLIIGIGREETHLSIDAYSTPQHQPLMFWTVELVILLRIGKTTNI